MKLEYAKIELDERRRLGDKVYEDIYCRVQNSNGRNEIDETLYPQGDAKTKLLAEQFQRVAPFYLKKNSTIVVRQTNPNNYLSTME